MTRTILALSLLVASCGAAAQQHTAYGAEVVRCIANERAIVDRAGTTETQDRADMAAERSRCDAALATIISNGGH